MSCRICGRSSCTESFHTLEQQELFEQRQAMPDDVDLLRRMVQEAAAEILSLKAELASESKWAKEYLDRAELAEKSLEDEKMDTKILDWLERASHAQILSLNVCLFPHAGWDEDFFGRDKSPFPGKRNRLRASVLSAIASEAKAT